jgi:mRNA interferase RelE/StbE
LKVEFKRSFARDIKKVKDRVLLQELKVLIDQVKNAASVHEISNLKQLKG